MTFCFFHFIREEKRGLSRRVFWSRGNLRRHLNTHDPSTSVKTLGCCLLPCELLQWTSTAPSPPARPARPHFFICKRNKNWGRLHLPGSRRGSREPGVPGRLCAARESAVRVAMTGIGDKEGPGLQGRPGAPSLSSLLAYTNEGPMMSFYLPSCVTRTLLAVGAQLRGKGVTLCFNT